MTKVELNLYYLKTKFKSIYKDRKKFNKVGLNADSRQMDGESETRCGMTGSL